MPLKTRTDRAFMQIRVFRHIQEAAEISEQWNELLSYASHVPFLRLEYLNSCGAPGGGNGRAESVIVTGSWRMGSWLGSPRSSSLESRRYTVAMLVGSIEISIT
jgi:hypothetical protein